MSKFFFHLLSSDQFSYRTWFDVWGRLCTHFEAAKVRTFATVTQHFSVSTAASHTHICTLTTYFFVVKNVHFFRILHTCWTWKTTVSPKKWVIITEISKEVENNAIGRLNVYAKQYVPRRTGTAGGSSGGGGSSGRSWMFPLCVYTFVCVEIKTKRETTALCMIENVYTMLVREDRLFGFWCKWVHVLWSFLTCPDTDTWIPSEGRRRPDFFFLTFLSRLLPTLSLW